MNGWEWARVLGVIGPIVVLVFAGLALTARSGIARFAAPNGARRLAENLSHTVILVGGCLLGLAVLHQLVGQPLPCMW